MVIRLSPTMEKRVARAAKAKGVKPDRLVESILKQRLPAEDKPREQVSEARRQLDQLLKHMSKPADFDAAVHAAKRHAGRLYEDNAGWIERASHQQFKVDDPDDARHVAAALSKKCDAIITFDHHFQQVANVIPVYSPDEFLARLESSNAD